MRLDGKVAVITGGGRGIGRAIAEAFADEGARIVIASRTESELQTVASQISRNGGKARAVVCDVTVEEQVERLIRTTTDEFGGVDILVNNAGAGSMRPVWSIPRESFESVLAVNLIGTFLPTKHVWKPMQRRGGGSIINVSSLGGLRGYPLLSAYCASKWGQIGFTKACAEEGKRVGIRVNAIAPGKADTAFRDQIEEDKSRMLAAEDHVGTALYLASDESRYVTGHVIPIAWFETRGES